MSTFTITIQELLNLDFDFGLTSDDYPIYDEKLRGVLVDGKWDFNKVDNGTGGKDFFGLNKMILDHYMYWEIGYETEDMFRFALNRKMREIMPYYNQLFASTMLQFDPLQTLNTIHATTTSEAIDETDNNTTTNTAGSTTTSQNRAINSSFPQMMLAGSEDYATAGADTNGQSQADTTSNATGEGAKHIGSAGDTTTHLSGSNGHAAALLMAYRRTFLNIALMVVGEIEPLFMMITDSTDDRFERGNSATYVFPFGTFYYPVGL